MLIDLKSIQKGYNDSIYVNIGGNNILHLNFVNEDISFGDENLKVDEINLELFQNEGSKVSKISNIIGLETGAIQIITEHAELIGQKLSAENKDNCYLLTLY